jgi:hypothetical protein
MNQAVMTSPLTARNFLLGAGNAGDTAEELSRSLSERGVARTGLHGLRRLSGSALGAVDREIANVTNGLLDLDIGDVLVSGWRKYGSLREAARHTLAAPGSEEVVILATHRIVATFRPCVDLLVDGVKVNTFEFELTLVLDLDGLVAVVRDGRLEALRGGDCVLTATLSLEGGQLARRQGHIDPGLVVRLDPPVALLGDDDVTKPAVPPQAAPPR